MSKYSIGLDLGINNVGWAKYDLTTHQVVDKGVVRFEASDDAQGRRAVRSSRRGNKRSQHRVERLSIVLKKYGFNTQRSYEPELLLKRIKGLKEELSEQEISNIIYYFAIHRGYIPFDDENPEREVHIFKDDEYPCEYLKQYLDEYNVYRGQADFILAKDNVRELCQILKTQSVFNKKINDKFINDVIDELTKKREFWEGPGAAKPNQLSKYGRYRTLEDLEKLEQDPTYHKYLYEMLIGKCDLSVDKNGNMEACAPTYNYYAEEFNFLNDFINMRINNIPEYYKDCFIKSNAGNKFSCKGIETIKNYILTQSTVSFEKMLTSLFGLELSDITGYRIDKSNKPEISKFEFFKYVLKQFKTVNLDTSWIESNDKTVYNKIIYVLTVAPNAFSITDMISDRVSERKFSEAEIEVLKNIKKKKNEELKYHSLSENLLIRAINDIKAANCEFNYMQIMTKKDYEKEKREYFNNTYSLKTKAPFLVEDKYIDDLIANPQVKKTLRKAIKVINAIIKDDEQYPEYIVVESATELNGKDEKNRIINEQRKFEALRKDAINLLENNSITVNKSNIERVILWKETGEKCCYCEKPISLNDLLKLEIEHIIPESDSADSTMDNKTCSCGICNREKSDQTAYKYICKQNYQLQDYIKRVSENKYFSQQKKKYLLFSGESTKYAPKFINRNLRDNAYASVALKEELKKYNDFLDYKTGTKNCINIVSMPGQLTHRVREALDIEEKDREYLFHHAVDAMILSSLVDTNVGKILVETQNNPKYWVNTSAELIQRKQNLVTYIKNIHLQNDNQIRNFHNDCNNQPADNKDGLVKRSFEVKRNPIQQFADTNYCKFIKKGDNFYSIGQYNNIYTIENTDKKIEVCFNENDSKIELLCEKNDKALFNRLKSIWYQYKDQQYPFLAASLFEHGIENGTTPFNPYLHGIKKNDNPNSPVVISLRYMSIISTPYIKQSINNRRSNCNGEFIESHQKDNTYVGLTSLSQVCTRIYYDLLNQKFIFMPINSICFNDKKELDTNNFYYKETFNRLIGDKKVLLIGDVYPGEWIKAEKKDRNSVEGKYSGYDKTSNALQVYLNGESTIAGKDGRTKIASSAKRIIIYTTDILGNRYIRLDTKNII